jgi:hypothetical protein
MLFSNRSSYNLISNAEVDCTFLLFILPSFLWAQREKAHSHYHTYSSLITPYSLAVSYKLYIPEHFFRQVLWNVCKSEHLFGFFFAFIYRKAPEATIKIRTSFVLLVQLTCDHRWTWKQKKVKVSSWTHNWKKNTYNIYIHTFSNNFKL